MRLMLTGVRLADQSNWFSETALLPMTWRGVGFGVFALFALRRLPRAGTTMGEPIFVFGSNEAGRHGKGAALFALRHRGAIYGQAWGHQGNSFAIPTKSATLETLPLGTIRGYVSAFLDYAKKHPELTFQLTPIGCGLAGYQREAAADVRRGASQCPLAARIGRTIVSDIKTGYQGFRAE